MWVRSLGWEGPLEEGMATHFSVLAWKIPWTEELGGLQSVESQKSQTRLSDWAQHGNDLLSEADLIIFCKEVPSISPFLSVLLLCTESVLLKKICCSPQNVTLFGNRIFTEVIKLKWGQAYRFIWLVSLWKEEIWAQRQTCIQGKYHVNRKRLRRCIFKPRITEDGQQTIRSWRSMKQIFLRGLGRNQPCQSHYLRFLGSRNVRQ